jgi:hypothetical protein
VVRGGPCTEACRDAEAAYAYHGRVSLESFRPPPWTCPSGSPCMDGADPGDAVAQLRELL